MLSDKIHHLHIVGIGGCASSAVAQYLVSNGINVTGSERSYRDLTYLSDKGIRIYFGHYKDNIYLDGKAADYVLYSPAVVKFDPDNVELAEARRRGIPAMSWENFIGEYLNTLGKIGITISGSEGKGTTGGILTKILQGTEFDPLSILGANMKNTDKPDSNIYVGEGKSYILEGDEFNRNFYGYHPSINVTVNFKYEHPETYKDFDEYKAAFAHFFGGMNGDNHQKTLILRATSDMLDVVKKYKLGETHKIIWFGLPTDDAIDTVTGEKYIISDHILRTDGNEFILRRHLDGELADIVSEFKFKLDFLPGYIVLNAVGAIIAAFELGLDYETIQRNINRFTGMVRRFDVTKTTGKGVIITDYGHSPESISHIMKELKTIYKGMKLHFVFQPHLFSRTFAFADGFAESLAPADKISLIDIYPAREHIEDWADKISSSMLADKIRPLNPNVEYIGAARDIYTNLHNKLNADEVTCFIGAGDMDAYYGKLIDELKKK